MCTGEKTVQTFQRRNCAHNVGGAASGGLAAFALSRWDGLEPAFWFPGVVALVVAVAFFLRNRDTPASVGLPPIEEYRHDPPKVDTGESENELSVWTVVRKHVLASRTIVNLEHAHPGKA